MQPVPVSERTVMMTNEASPVGGAYDNPRCIPTSPVSPYKRLMAKGSFQQYLREETNILAAKYPFLTKHQIKKKAAQLWSRLPEPEKRNYTCIAPSLFKLVTLEFDKLIWQELEVLHLYPESFNINFISLFSGSRLHARSHWEPDCESFAHLANF